MLFDRLACVSVFVAFSTLCYGRSRVMSFHDDQSVFIKIEYDSDTTCSVCTPRSVKILFPLTSTIF